MATFSLRRWRLITTCVVIAAMVAALVFARGSATSAHETPRLASAEIVDALLFSEGPGADYLTSMKREVEWTEELRGFQRAVMDAIAEDHYYSEEFAEHMQSGDPLRVQEALNRLAGTVQETLNRLYGPEVINEAFRAVEVAWESEDLLRDSVQDKELAPLNADLGLFINRETLAYIHTFVFNDQVITNVTFIYVLYIFFEFANSLGEVSNRTRLAREIQAARIAADLRYAG